MKVIYIMEHLEDTKCEENIKASVIQPFSDKHCQHLNALYCSLFYTYMKVILMYKIVNNIFTAL